MATTQQLVTAIGETDQLFLKGNSPELAIKRTYLRLQLIELSQYSTEKEYFLKEAIAIAEIALMAFGQQHMANDEANTQEPLFDAIHWHLEIACSLVDAYFCYYHHTAEKKYLIIIEQIIRPLSHHRHIGILKRMVELYTLGDKPKLTQYWQKKLDNLSKQQFIDTSATLKN